MRPMLAALLAGAGFISLIARRSRSTGGQRSGSQDARAAEHRAGPAREVRPVRPFPPPPDGAEQAEQREHRSTERRHWKRSEITGAVSTVGALAAALFAAGAYFATRDQADTARKALFANDRPWVKPESITVTAMHIDDMSVTVWAKVMVKNVGKSPAQGVFFTPYILLPDLDKDHLSSMIETCDKKKTWRASVFRAILFPDEVKNIQHGEDNAIFLRFMVDIEKAKKARRKERLDNLAEFNKSMRELGWNNRQVEPESEDEFPFHTTFTLAGCITYSAYAAPDIYQTTFTVQLDRVVPGWPLGGSFDTTRRGYIPLEEIHQKDPFAGDFAN